MGKNGKMITTKEWDEGSKLEMLRAGNESKKVLTRFGKVNSEVEDIRSKVEEAELKDRKANFEAGIMIKEDKDNKQVDLI